MGVVIKEGGNRVIAKVVFYSMYGHIYKMAEAVAEGVRDVEGASAELLQVPELIPDAVLEKSGAAKSRQAFSQVPVAKPDDLLEADAIIIGTPTRFGNMCGQMRNFLDQTGSLWARNALVGKVGSAFTSSATQHGGQETTIVSTYLTLLHHGMIIVGLPYCETRQTTLEEITGGSPYGCSTIAGGDGSRWPTENEIEMARFQGRHVARIAKRLAGGLEDLCT
ncbi:MAG: NAD(P)H:quinone oxidoreductase [Dehalococcoidia bacterium]